MFDTEVTDILTGVAGILIASAITALAVVIRRRIARLFPRGTGTEAPRNSNSYEKEALQEQHHVARNEAPKHDTCHPGAGNINKGPGTFVNGQVYGGVHNYHTEGNQ